MPLVSLAGLGDVNGDGRDDVGAAFSAYGGPTADAIYVYLGAANGLDAATPTALALTAGQDTVREVTGAGDVDGDGYDDVIVVSYGDDTRALSLHRGAAAGIERSAATVLWGEDGDALGAYEVSAAGDVNGDGYDDVVAGLHTAFRIFLGSPAGLSDEDVESLAPTEYFMGRVAGVGDLDGDGFADVAVAPSPGIDAPWSGYVLVYFGSPDGLVATEPRRLVRGRV